MTRLSMLPVLLVAALTLTAATTKTWEMNTYEDFLQGRFDGVSLTRDGRLELAPELTTLFTSDQPVIWSVVQASDGTLYLGTGHRGRIYRVSKSGQSEVIWTSEEPEVFALALDGEGRLYAATSPNGKVYRIENGAATEYFAPETTYIWSLAFGSDDALYVGTGEGGEVYRVTKPGQGEVYYETGQAHVTSLAHDSSGRLLAGTEPNGILYRITEKGRAFVLYDANLPEVRALVPMPDGAVYAAALGGSVAQQVLAATSSAARQAAGAVAQTSITVSAAQADLQIKPQPSQPKPASAPAASALPMPMFEYPGVEKSALFKINPDNTVEKIWTSTEENAYGLLAFGNRVVLSTDQKGRLYDVAPDGKVTLLLQTNEEEAVRLLKTDDGLLVATSHMGKLYRVGEGSGSKGTYEAPVHDAARVARWGRLGWRLSSSADGAVGFQTRSGNSARPDKTWSDWSEPLTDSGGSQVSSPNARYIQWRAVLEGKGGRTPVLDSVQLAYLPPNAAPKVTGITVSSLTSERSAQAAGAAPQTATTAAYSITVTDTGEPGPSTVSGTATQKLSRSSSDEIQITWQTEDLDGDELIYALYFRGEEEQEWKLLKDELDTASYKIDSDALADGKYHFRVVTSDERVNPEGAARQGEYVSVPVLVDHTPPVLSAQPARSSGDATEVEVEATDAASPLQRCEYSLDAGSWRPLASVDGIIDSKDERFMLRLKDLPSGERLLVVRAYDSAGNAGLVKVVLRQE